MIYNKHPYHTRVGGVISRFLNVTFLNGHPSESISGRSWRMRLEHPKNRFWWRMCRFVDFLFFYEKDHCRTAYLEDIHYANARVNAHKNLNK